MDALDLVQWQVRIVIMVAAWLVAWRSKSNLLRIVEGGMPGLTRCSFK
jgi:hypothetical protein